MSKKVRQWLLLTLDASFWVLAVPIAVFMRFDFQVGQDALSVSLVAGLAAAVIYVGLASIFRVYAGRYVIGSLDEAVGLVPLYLTIAALGIVASFTTGLLGLPRSTFVIATGLAAILLLSSRLIWRQHRRSRATQIDAKRVLIYGAGSAGAQLASLLLADSNSDLRPIGFLDDDASKANLRVGRLRVLGTARQLRELIADTRPDIILVAITSANAELLQDLDTICTETGTRLQVIPTASQLVKDQLSLGDITDVTDEELMGRRSYVTDETSIRKMIMNMTVLVTGAGGSIGSELATQLAGYQPKRLLLLDRDESALHSVQLRLDGTGNLASSNLLLVDIRDGATIFELFQSMKPDIVFHAAALKHLPLLERFPHEAWKTNVVGTSNVLRAALDSGTEIFVNVSTDKAAEPASTLGHSKLITERMTAGVSPDASRRFMSVRFGNVLGSRGSVIATFQHQIRQGGPVTITHPEITRYLMTTREAVNLVLQAAVVGRPGETLVLDMGRPVRILDVARKLISKAGKDVDIVYTGLRKGEKLHEKLIADSEKSLQQVHPSISHICVDPLPLDYTENAFQADLAEQTSWSHEPRRQISSHDGLHS